MCTFYYLFYWIYLQYHGYVFNQTFNNMSIIAKVCGTIGSIVPYIHVLFQSIFAAIFFTLIPRNHRTPIYILWQSVLLTEKTTDLQHVNLLYSLQKSYHDHRSSYDIKLVNKSWAYQEIDQKLSPLRHYFLFCSQDHHHILIML